MPLIFSGSAHLLLAQEVASYLGVALGKRQLSRFPDNEIFVEIEEEVQGRDVFVLQPFGLDPNVHLMELCILLDALKRASVASLTVVVPYYGYARQDRLDKPGVSITAKLVADILSCAGISRVLVMDLHSEQIEGFFNVPVRHLLSRTLLMEYCASLQVQSEELVIVAPDKGGIKMASAYAKYFNVPLALVEKERVDAFRVEMRLFVGEVRGKTVILPDDMCATAGTLVNAANVCAQFGAKRIIAVVGHGLFLEDALEKIERSPIEMLVTTNSLPIADAVARHPKIRVVSIAPLLANAIESSLFH